MEKIQEEFLKIYKNDKGITNFFNKIKKKIENKLKRYKFI